MSQQFEPTCDNISNQQHLVSLAGTLYDDVPDEVRKRGLWQLIRTGDVTSLLPEYRHGLARDAYVYIEPQPIGLKVPW